MAFYENINLIFGGIDTFVDLTFNKHDLHVDYNMFRPQIRDVKSYYKVSSFDNRSTNIYQ